MRHLGNRFHLLSFTYAIPFLLLAGSGQHLFGQSAPYVLPYTITSYAGAHGTYTAGAACGNYVALDGDGAGCLATQYNVGVDPHDVRVDAKGNVYFINNASSSGYVVRINPFDQRVTAFAGSIVNTKSCATQTTKYGDNCPSTDGAANNNSANLTTSSFKAYRGLGSGFNGDLLIAGYNDDYIHGISAATGIMSVITGTGTAGSANGAVGTAQVNGARGAGEDASADVYVADSGNNVLREVVNGVTSDVTAPNSAGTKTISSNVPASQALLSAPEDAQVDVYGNVYIADFGNNVLRAIYHGGTLPGISNPVAGNIYTIAGNDGAASPNNTYPTDGTTPAYPALNVQIALRKFGLDGYGNVYIADSTNNVVWFVDHATGYIRVIAGRFGETATTTPSWICSASTDAVGDGCPATQAGLDANSDMGADPDFFGNLYISDAEGGNATLSRIRKVVSGLNFPAVAMGSNVTQNVMIHFAPGDTPAAANAYVINGTASDYTVGAPSCTAEADNTDDCIIPITFAPSQPGDDTATLKIASAAGGVNSYLLTGYGTVPAIAFDPGDVTQLSATINNAQGMAIDGAGNAYIADTANNRILYYNASSGATTVFAGASANCSSASDSFGDGCPATQAKLNAPRAIALDAGGNVYIADTGNNLVRKVSANGTITLYGGGASSVCAIATDTRGDGCEATQATFSSPSGLAADAFGVLYVADTGNNVIRAISSTGFVSTFAGGASAVCAAEVESGGTVTTPGATDSEGDGCSASQTIFSSPTALAFDATGSNIFVADTGNNIVRKIYLGNTIDNSGATVPKGSVFTNLVTLVAGDGQAGDSISSSGFATLSQLNAPNGVAVDAAGNVYIADTGNDAVRLVNAASGVITTIAGINGTSGTGTVPGGATGAELNAPAAVAVNLLGTLYIADSGNNRLLSDARSQITYSFGRTNVGYSSPVANITELNIGSAAANLPAPLFTPASGTSPFSLAAAANGNGSIAGCTSGSLAAGAICNLQAQFTPASTGAESNTYTQTSTGAAGLTPVVNLSGLGAVLTVTTSAVAQTTPAAGASPQYGGSLAVTATIAPASCNTSAPSCYPTGTVSVVVDGTPLAPAALSATGAATVPVPGLSVGNHTISCNYSGDDYYAASTCSPITIAVVQASTTSTLAATNNNQPQFLATNCKTDAEKDQTCIVSVLTATVVSNTIGIPNGNVTFYANGTALGTVALAANGTVSFPLEYEIDAGGNTVSNNTLSPGTYTLTCSYAGPSGSDYASSNCAGVSYTVAPSPATFSLVAYPCVYSSLYEPGTTTPSPALSCPNGQTMNGTPEVAVAEGSTTDATIFISPTNTVSGTLTFSCAGLPASSTCTFSPTSITLTPGSGYPSPTYVDVTFWNDLQPGNATSMVRRPSIGNHHGATLATIFGWPLLAVGLGMIGFGNRKRRRPLFLPLLLLVAGASLTFSGCAGPGAYKPVLTAAGTYPVTITVTGGGVTKTVVVDYTVTAPGIPGQE